MKANRAAVAAAIIAIFTTGASAHLSRSTSAGAPATAMNADEGVPHNMVTAMPADEGVPHNMVTAMPADEGVPHNMVTAMPADEGVPHDMVTAADEPDRTPEHREEAPKHLV